MKRIMSGESSKPLWNDINSIRGWKARKAVYHLGCKCQELESLLRRALKEVDRVKSDLAILSLDKLVLEEKVEALEQAQTPSAENPADQVQPS